MITYASKGEINWAANRPISQDQNLVLGHVSDMIPYLDGMDAVFTLVLLMISTTSLFHLC